MIDKNLKRPLVASADQHLILTLLCGILRPLGSQRRSRIDFGEKSGCSFCLHVNTTLSAHILYSHTCRSSFCRITSRIIDPIGSSTEAGRGSPCKRALPAPSWFSGIAARCTRGKSLAKCGEGQDTLRGHTLVEVELADRVYAGQYQDRMTNSNGDATNRGQGT